MLHHRSPFASRLYSALCLLIDLFRRVYPYVIWLLTFTGIL